MASPDVHPHPVPPLPRFVTIGFVGKRKLPAGEAGLRTTLERVFDELRTEFHSPDYQLVGLSSLALGADTVFAEFCAARDILQQIFLPEFRKEFFALPDFDGNQALAERSRACLDQPAVLEVRLTGTSENNEERFAETAFEIVNECDLLIVACLRAEYDSVCRPGGPLTKPRRGGSAETLFHALGERRLRVIILDDPAPTASLTLIVHDTVPAALPFKPLGFEQPEPIVEKGKAPPLLVLDYPKALAAIQNRADQVAQENKSHMVRDTQWTLLAHLLATGCAAYLVVFHPANPWGLFLSFLEVVLLAVGLQLIRRAHHRTNQGPWLEARLLTELARSAGALLAEDADKPLAAGEPLPVAPRYLREFYIPEVADFTKSLYLLHLREVRKDALLTRAAWQAREAAAQTAEDTEAVTKARASAEAATLERLKTRYVQQRIGDDLPQPAVVPRGILANLFAGLLRPFARLLNKLRSRFGWGDAPAAAAKSYSTGQLEYFAPKAATAASRRDQADQAFLGVTRWAYYFTLVALVVSVVGLLLPALWPTLWSALWPGWLGAPDEHSGWGKKLWMKFLPLTLPALAAGVLAWIGLHDLDRQAERYAAMADYLRTARESLLNAKTTAQLRRRVERAERTLLQEIVEWYAKMRSTRTV